MIKKILRSIRQKPKAVREQYAFWIASCLTSVVAVGWFMSVTGQVAVPMTPADTDEVATTAPGSLSSFLSDAQKQIGAVQQEVLEVLPAALPASEPVVASSSVTATSSAQAAAVITASQPAIPQEVRIATTSASTSTATSSPY